MARKKTYHILLLPGDGVGPELMRAGRQVLERCQSALTFNLNIREALIGGAALTAEGAPISESTLKLAKQSHAVVTGPVGGSAWNTVADDQRPELAPGHLHNTLKLFARVRPAYVIEPVLAASPLKPDRVSTLDIVLISQLDPKSKSLGRPSVKTMKSGRDKASDTLELRDDAIVQVAELALSIAQGRQCPLTAVHHSDLPNISHLWQRVITEVAAKFPQVSVSHVSADACAAGLVQRPMSYGVILAPQLLGDVLGAEAMMLTGSTGLLASASIGPKNVLYQVHQSTALGMAGQDQTNPVAMISAIGMMLGLSFGEKSVESLIRTAIQRVLEAGYRTQDIAEPDSTPVGCEEFTRQVIDRLSLL